MVENLLKLVSKCSQNGLKVLEGLLENGLSMAENCLKVNEDTFKFLERWLKNWNPTCQVWRIKRTWQHVWILCRTKHVEDIKNGSAVPILSSRRYRAVWNTFSKIKFIILALSIPCVLKLFQESENCSLYVCLGPKVNIHENHFGCPLVSVMFLQGAMLHQSFVAFSVVRLCKKN